jgi:putative flippase GtrA
MREVLSPLAPLAIAEAAAHAVGIGAGAILNYNAHRMVTFHRARGHRS